MDKINNQTTARTVPNFSGAENTLGALVAASFTALVSTPAVIAVASQNMTYDLADKGGLALTAYVVLLGAATTAGFVRDAYKAFRYERQF